MSPGSARLMRRDQRWTNYATAMRGCSTNPAELWSTGFPNSEPYCPFLDLPVPVRVLRPDRRQSRIAGSSEPNPDGNFCWPRQQSAYVRSHLQPIQAIILGRKRPDCQQWDPCTELTTSRALGAGIKQPFPPSPRPLFALTSCPLPRFAGCGPVSATFFSRCCGENAVAQHALI